jgi:hypothetical protein
VWDLTFANSRLLGRQVTFRYQRRRERQWKTMTLPASEFIRRFQQHVLPRGTHKVPYYGIWNPAHRPLLSRVQLATGPLRIPEALDDEGTLPTAGAPQGPSERRRRTQPLRAWSTFAVCSASRKLIIRYLTRPCALRSGTSTANQS